MMLPSTTTAFYHTDLSHYADNATRLPPHLTAPETPLPLDSRGRDFTPGSLFAELSPIVGREDELDELYRHLRSSTALTVLVGPPGIGKSRIALEIAKKWVNDRRNAESVVFIDMSNASSMKDVLRLFAESLELSLNEVDTNDEGLEIIASALRRATKPLVVLDNCEHLNPISRHLGERLLHLVAGIALLLTSRELLGAPREIPFLVEPLESGLTERMVQTGENSPALELFLTRANQARSTWSPETTELPLLQELIVALEGNPLAIELCAARIGALGLSEIQRHLHRKLELLRVRECDRGARWTSLQGALEWSWALLDDDEKRALTQLALFRKGCTLSAALGTFALEKPGLQGVLDVLDSLREKSLLTVLDTPGHVDARRYTLSTSVRELALNKLEEEGEMQSALEAHARYFLDLFDSKETDGRLTHTFARPNSELESELENLNAIYDRAMAGQLTDPSMALEALSIMAPLMTTRGPFKDYIRRLEAAINAIGDRRTRPELIARAQTLIAYTEVKRGQCFRAAVAYQRALQLSEKQGLKWLRAFSLLKLGGLVSLSSQRAAPSTSFDLARELIDELNDPHLEALYHEELSTSLFWRSPGEAERAQEKARFLYREAGDDLREAYTLGQLGFSRFTTGNIESAERSARDALRMLEEIGDIRWASIMRTVLALIEQEQGKLDEAESTLREVLEVQRNVANRWLEAFVRALLSDLLSEAGRYDEAAEGYQEALEITRPLQEKATTAWILSGLGVVNAALDRISLAKEHFDEAVKNCSELQIPLLDRCVTLRRLHLDLAISRHQRSIGEAPLAEALLNGVRATLDEFADAEKNEFTGQPRSIIRRPYREVLHALKRDELNRRSGLVVADDGSWFRVGAEQPVSLARRRHPRNILTALVKLRSCSPGAGMNVESLFEAGWPNEKATPQSAANRVYVTLTRMRKLGLADLLQNDESGFYLDPAAPLQVELVSSPGN